MSLVYLGLAEQLASFFDRVYVPKAVQVEVNRKGRFRYRLQKLYNTGIFARCASGDQTNVELLSAESKVDKGEAEALVQAQEIRATVFIGDERRAREIGTNLGLKTVGTVGILARLSLEGRARDTPVLVEKLRRDRAFRVSEDVVREAVARAHEPI